MLWIGVCKLLSVFGGFVKFTFARQPEVPVIFPERLAARIFKMKEDSRVGLQT